MRYRLNRVAKGKVNDGWIAQALLMTDLASINIVSKSR